MSGNRVLEIGTRKYTEVVCVDSPGAGGACHQYVIKPVGDSSAVVSFATQISFQNGPVKEKGVNGCHNEDLLAIVIDRLQDFQRGIYRCRENAIALTKLEEALMWLKKRTEEREVRGVEGTSEI